jgi:hypothetical protein
MSNTGEGLAEAVSLSLNGKGRVERAEGQRKGKGVSG